MFDGDGRIISELLIIFNRGCVFHILWVIVFIVEVQRQFFVLLVLGEAK